MTRKQKLTINLPADVIERAKAAAEEGGSSLSVVTERLLVQWLESGARIPARPFPGKYPQVAPAEAKGGRKAKTK